MKPRARLGAALVALPLLTLGQTDAETGLPARLAGLKTVAVALPGDSTTGGDHSS